MKEIKKAYQKCFINKIIPHLAEINNLIQEADTQNITSQYIEPGYHKKNRAKYFDFEQRQVFINNYLSKIFHSDKLFKPVKILDVGCAYGDYMAILQRFGHDITGINGGGYIKDFEYVNQLLGLNVVNLDLITDDFPQQWNEKFDVILCFETLTLPMLKPHANKIIAKFLLALKPYGKIIIINHHNKKLDLKIHILEYHILNANTGILKSKIN